MGRVLEAAVVDRTLPRPDDLFSGAPRRRRRKNPQEQPGERGGSRVSRSFHRLRNHPEAPPAYADQERYFLTKRTRSAGLKGFVMYSSAPCFIPQNLSLSWSFCVHMMIGMCLYFSSVLSVRQTWNPFFFGMMTSRIMRLIGSALTFSSAASPSMTVMSR